jgi:hypothetical protein
MEFLTCNPSHAGGIGKGIMIQRWSQVKIKTLSEKKNN